LQTLAGVKLYEGHVFGRSYDTRTGALVRWQHDAGPVAGWSATDIGRMLTWLAIVGADPRLANEANAVAHRLDFGRLVKQGYVWGSNLDSAGTPVTYQEGRIGYEQSAAQGYALWGYRAEQARN